MQSKIDQEIFESVHSLMHQYRSKMYRALRDTSLDLSHMENKVLGFFARHPNSTLSALAEFYNRDKAQLTRLIKVLKDKALIEECKDEHDRRKTLLNLTPKGRDVHEILHKESLSVCKNAVIGLETEECLTLIRLLNKLKDNLTE
jgi:DNA-binding MarR family transcriptional regulator